MVYVLGLLGLVLLVVGAEFLVKGASRLAAKVGVSPLVIGLTVVAFGTSAPELAVSVKSSWGGAADIAVGNVVGSNIFNILLILGLSGVVAPLVVAQQIVRKEVPLMIGASVLFYVLAMDGALARWEGALLFLLAIGYTAWTIIDSRRENNPEVIAEYADEFDPNAAPMWQNLGLIALGLGGLVLGSTWLVDAAVHIARSLGVSELVIGLTVIAAGTSLPEVATSVMASMRGERDIAVGNVVGSNMFNILVVLGLATTVSPTSVAISAEALAFDIPVMIAVAVACWPIFARGFRIDRWEAAIFLAYYVLYTAFLILNASSSPALGTFTVALTTFVIPLTLITLVAVWVNSWRKGELSLKP